jgi:hypothetical protein
VTNLLGKKKIYIYYMNKLSQLRVGPVYPIFRQWEMRHVCLQVYLDRTQHLEDLQLLLTEQTEIEPGSQILLLNVRPSPLTPEF